MLARALWIAAAPLAAFVGSVGAGLAIKSVYVERRGLSRACVCGASRVPRASSR